jgi:hypothetical protein
MRRTRSPAASDLAGQPARLRLTAGWAPSHWQCGQPRLPGSDSDSEPEPGARARPPTGRLPGRSAAAGGLCCLCIMMPGASGPSDSRTRTAVATVAVPESESERSRTQQGRVAAVGPGIGTRPAAATASPRAQSARRDRQAVLTDRSAAAGPGACTAPAGPPGHHQATHVVASRCDARPAVTRTRTGGAAADRLTVGLPGRVRRRVGPARKDSESGVPARRLQRPPRPLQRRSHRRRRAALLRSTVVVTGHGHGRTHFVERSPSHGRAAAAESPSRTAAPAAVSDPAAG